MEIIFIIGDICSGKSTRAQSYPSNYFKLDVGDIVRNLTRTSNRIHNPDLDEEIVDQLITTASLIYNKRFGYNNLVIVGVRQLSIYQDMVEKLPYIAKDFSVTVELLEVPLHTLQQRYLQRQASKDTFLTLNEAIEKDNKLGLLDLKAYFYSINKNTNTNNGTIVKIIQAV